MFILLAAACGGDATGPDPVTPGQGSLLVTGGSMGPEVPERIITRDNQPVVWRDGYGEWRRDSRGGRWTIRITARIPRRTGATIRSRFMREPRRSSATR